MLFFVKNPWKKISHVIRLSHLQTHTSGPTKKDVDHFSERVAICPWILPALKRWNLWKRWIPQMLKKTKNLMSRTWWWEKLKQANHHKLTTSAQHPDSFPFFYCVQYLVELKLWVVGRGISLTESESEESERVHFLPKRLMIPSLNIIAKKDGRVESRSTRTNQSQRSRGPTFCDWLCGTDSSASTYDSVSLVSLEGLNGVVAFTVIG